MQSSNASKQEFFWLSSRIKKKMKNKKKKQK